MNTCTGTLELIHLGHGITFPGNAKVLSTLMIAAISYGLVFSINSFSRDVKEYR